MSVTTESESPKYVVEGHSVNFIPPGERHGHARDLAPFWFAENQQFLTIVTGLLAIILGLDLFWAIVAIVVGNLFGAIFMAYHSAQGPKLGIPQMIQSRAQFGFYGAFFLFLATFFLQFGFFASTQVLAGETLNALTSHVSIPLAIILLTVPVLVLAILGYRWLHVWQRVATVVFAVTLAIATVQTFVGHHLPAGSLSTKAPSWPTFLVVVSIIAVYQISWAPFVSDYSRYLPETTSISSTFWATYAGTTISCVWLQTLGCIVTVLYPKASTVTAFATVSGRWILFVLAVSLIGAAATNLYGGMLALVTMLSSWVEIKRSVFLRVGGIVVTMVVGLAVALAGYRSFLTNFTNFLLVLLFLFVPWTAVNLTDFYLIRHGEYETRSFFTPHRLYGPWIWQGLVSYAIGLAIEVPFVDQTLYVGPLAKAMGGADISWIIGIVVPAVVYYLICRRFPPKVAEGVLLAPDADTAMSS